jgi:hypothetical protein
MEGVRRGPPNAVRHHGEEKEEEKISNEVVDFNKAIGNGSLHGTSNDNGGHLSGVMVSILAIRPKVCRFTPGFSDPRFEGSDLAETMDF